eukprot:2092865-Heterocapsa_arctica.AAC.1
MSSRSRLRMRRMRAVPARLCGSSDLRHADARWQGPHRDVQEDWLRWMWPDGKTQDSVEDE